MAGWSEFESEAPELAALARERFDATELVLLGTNRPNGWPRISPIEYGYWEGEFVLGGMWRSKKFLDVMRDNRVTIHSTTSNKNGQEGDVKLYARLLPLASGREESYWEHVFATIGWRPKGPAHVYTTDLVSGSYLKFGADGMMSILTWPGNRWSRVKSS